MINYAAPGGGAPAFIWSCRFSGDSSHVAVANWNGHAYLYEISAPAWPGPSSSVVSNISATDGTTVCTDHSAGTYESSLGRCSSSTDGEPGGLNESSGSGCRTSLIITEDSVPAPPQHSPPRTHTSPPTSPPASPPPTTTATCSARCTGCSGGVASGGGGTTASSDAPGAGVAVSHRGLRSLSLPPASSPSLGPAAGLPPPPPRMSDKACSVASSAAARGSTCNGASREAACGAGASEVLVEVASACRGDRCYSVALDATAEHMAVGGRDKLVALYKTRPTQRLLWEVVAEDFVYAVALSNDLQYCVYGGPFKRVVVLDGSTGVPLVTHAYGGVIWSLVLLQGTSVCAVGGDSGLLSVLDIGACTELLQLPVSDVVYSLTLTECGLGYTNGHRASLLGAGGHDYTWREQPDHSVVCGLIIASYTDDESL
eukprot:5612170-Prymnesium_polylepis.1